jgi:hypothetical protein
MAYTERFRRGTGNRQRILERLNSYDPGVLEDDRRVLRTLGIEQVIEIEKAKRFGRAPV